MPIVPVVSVGGQETALFLSHGELARAACCGSTSSSASRSCRSRWRLPWGFNVGDFLGHLPLPAKITIEVLPPIDLAERFGEDPDVDEVYEHVTGAMQETLDALCAERRYPVIG